MSASVFFQRTVLRRCLLLLVMMVALGATAPGAMAQVVLYNVRYVLYSNTLYVTGNVNKDGQPAAGAAVDIAGDVNGNTTTNGSGKFSWSTPFLGYYGEASLIASHSGQSSNMVTIEFVE